MEGSGTSKSGFQGPRPVWTVWASSKRYFLIFQLLRPKIWCILLSDRARSAQRCQGGGVAGKAAAPSAGSKTKRPRRSVGKKDDAGEHRRHGEAVEKQRSAIM